MKKELFQEIEIPEGVEVSIEGNLISVKGSEGENKREFNINQLIFKTEGNKIIIGKKNSTKREKKLMNTLTAHIKNMIVGVQEKFEYKLKICFTHFPITVSINDNEAVIKNFLGERIPRKAKLLDDVEVKVAGDIITINSFNKESAGQTAANFEKATRITTRDRRVFQDGIFITNKSGREM
ncbi:50S ribosomal protein L6 [Nanoarchaeota archaeon]